MSDLAKAVRDPAIPRAMPTQKPGKSVQIVVTPWNFIDAVEKRWGLIRFDLAADRGNLRVRTNTSAHAHLGPGSKIAEDAFSITWARVVPPVNSWLNPPFGDICPWAMHCSSTVNDLLHPWGGTIFFLVPASVGSNWWAEHVHRKAAVKFLRPRLVFEGHTQSYPKDLALCIYTRVQSKGLTPGYECWRWDR